MDNTVQVERALLTQGEQGQLLVEASDLQLRGWPVWVVVTGLQGPGQHRFRWVRTERDAEGDTLAAHYEANDGTRLVIFND